MSPLNLISAVIVGILFTVGTYCMMSWNLQRVAIGFILLSNGVNLGIIAATGLPEGARPPLVVGDSQAILTDPLPQAFVLTAIVIGLGMAVFFLALVVRFYRESSLDTLADRGDVAS